MRVPSLVIVLILIFLIFSAGCTREAVSVDGKKTDVNTSITAKNVGITPGDLTRQVKDAVAYARENDRDKAIAAFNNPNGQFVQNGVYIFSETYNGTALAEPFHHEIVGTNIMGMVDRYGVPVVKNLAETAGYGIGFVSYDYPNPENNNRLESKLSVVANIDGTYYAGAGVYESKGMIYPSTAIGPAKRDYTEEELVTFVKKAVAYARSNGKDAALATFNDKNGAFADGELTIMAIDANGTVLASALSPQLSGDHINLINYHDPNGVATIREMRDISKSGGGISYTVAKVTGGGKVIYAPKIDYAEPVDDSWWVFAGIIVPEYEQLRSGNLTGITLRNHTRADLYDLVNRAVDFARTNGKNKTLTEINNRNGMFVSGDLFVWGETFDGTIIADPYMTNGVGKNFLNYTDPSGQKTTMVAINSIRGNTGFTLEMFPNTAQNGTKSVPKLVYMKAVDESWWIGSGIYGIEVSG